MNLCRACREDFGSLSAFDAHRIGRHEALWSPEREDGRRCLDAGELSERGWHQDRHGRWRTPRPDAQALFSALRNAKSRHETPSPDPDAVSTVVGAL
jgi:hypothetical protein